MIKKVIHNGIKVALYGFAATGAAALVAKLRPTNDLVLTVFIISLVSIIGILLLCIEKWLLYLKKKLKHGEK